MQQLTMSLMMDHRWRLRRGSAGSGSWLRRCGGDSAASQLAMVWAAELVQRTCARLLNNFSALACRTLAPRPGTVTLCLSVIQPELQKFSKQPVSQGERSGQSAHAYLP